MQTDPRILPSSKIVALPVNPVDILKRPDQINQNILILEPMKGGKWRTAPSDTKDRVWSGRTSIPISSMYLMDLANVMVRS